MRETAAVTRATEASSARLLVLGTLEVTGSDLLGRGLLDVLGLHDTPPFFWVRAIINYQQIKKKAIVAWGCDLQVYAKFSLILDLDNP